MHRRETLLSLVIASGGVAAAAQGFDVRVLRPPARLGADRAEAVLSRGIPGLRVVPSGTGELVVSGAPSLLAHAEALLKRLDRPRRAVVVEVHRGAAGRRDVREGGVAVNFGDRRDPSRFRRVTSTSRGGGVRHLRLEEGGEARLFVGGETPVVTDPFGGGIRTIQAGRALVVRLARVDPGRGAQLEVGVDTSAFGARGPAGPTVRREALSNSVYAPFGARVSLGGLNTAGAVSGGGPSVSLSGGPRGLDGSLGSGRRRERRRDFLDLSVVVREE